MAYQVIQLKAGREANVGFRHPWIFSGAVEHVPSGLPQGSFVHIADRNGRIIATGSYEGNSNIAIRVFDFSETTIDREWILNRIQEAHNRRLVMGYGPGTDTNGYRVVFGESDSLPGLVIDRYADVIVIQISTAGIAAIRDHVIDVCNTIFTPQAVVEKDEQGVRVHSGSVEGPVEFSEYGIRFVADILHGQKTGFFLDQKDLRQAVKNYSKDKTVLNLFSYTGSASVAALQGGATSVHNVDESQAALDLCSVNAQLNNVTNITTEQADVFSWFNTNTENQYGMVILDPPALTKTKKEKEVAAKAYHFINRAAMRLVEDGGIFVTSSCSHFFSEEDLAFTLRRASVQAGIQLHMLETVRQSPDHALSVYWPEGLYLKSYICRVERK
jgi:23S rRNA (cytosine1962-C5)-methyltransferase